MGLCLTNRRENIYGVVLCLNKFHTDKDISIQSIELSTKLTLMVDNSDVINEIEQYQNLFMPSGLWA